MREFRDCFQEEPFSFSCTGCPEREQFPDAGGKSGVVSADVCMCAEEHQTPLSGAPQQLEAPGKQYLPRQGGERDTPKVLSQVSQEGEWSPRGGWSRSRWSFRRSVCAEANKDSVTEGLNSPPESRQMSTWMACLVIWTHSINFWDRSVRQPACEAQFHLSLLFGRERWHSAAGDGSQRGGGTKAGSTARIQLFFMQRQDVKLCSCKSKNSSCQTTRSSTQQRKIKTWVRSWRKIPVLSVHKQPAERHASPSLVQLWNKGLQELPPFRWIIRIQNMVSKLCSTVWDWARTVPRAAWWPLQRQDPVEVPSMVTPELVSRTVSRWPGNTSSHPALLRPTAPQVQSQQLSTRR